MKCQLSKRKVNMLEHISISAEKVLEQIAKKRVGRTLEALDLAGCSEEVKFAVKKQIWEFKDEVESKVLGRGSCYEYEKQDN